MGSHDTVYRVWWCYNPAPKHMTVISAEVTTLLATMLGGALAMMGTLFQQKRETRHRKELLLRERGEELYGATVRWLNGLASFALRRSACMQGKLTYNQILDMDIEAGKGGSDYDRIELLIDVYFPSARSAYDAVVQEREKLNAIEAPFKQSYRQGFIPMTDTTSRSYLGQTFRLEDKGNLLLEEIKKCVQKIG
jgi:hypothetical protein